MPRRDQGITPDRYALIPRTLIFLTWDNCVLLLKGAPNKRLWADQYNGLGGHVERGEDVLTAARREVAEETGWPDLDLWLCGTITVDTGGGRGVAIYVFRGEAPGGELEPSPEGTLTWVNVDQLNTLDLVEDLPVLLPRVLAMDPGTPPFAAHSTYDLNGQLVIAFAD